MSSQTEIVIGNCDKCTERNTLVLKIGYWYENERSMDAGSIHYNKLCKSCINAAFKDAKNAIMASLRGV